MRHSNAGSFRVYNYIRVSTRDQAEYGTSLDGQRECGSKFCVGEDYPAPEVRIEVESAGEEKQERRIEMNRLLKELRAGDVLVCKDLSRWSRDQVRAVSTVRDLRTRGVKVRFYDQLFLDPQPGSPVDLLGIIAWAAETERKTTLHRSMGNRRLARQNGAFVEGRPPFGYTAKDRKLVIVTEHAVIVRRIFNDSLNGLSARQISDALRAEYPSVVVGRGKKHVMLWTVNNILKILRNRLYTGWMETTGKGRKHEDTGSGQWLQTHEPIIDVATFEKVSQGLSLRKRSGRSVGQSLTEGFLLKRTAVCSVCGYTVRTMMDKRVKSGESAYYLCAKRCDPAKYKDRKPCPNNKLVRQRAADDAAESLILARLDGLAAELAVAPPRAPEESPPDWKRLAAELAEARANVVRLVAKGIITEKDAARQLTEFKRDEEALEARRADWEQRETNDTEETRRAAFAKVREVRTVWARLSTDDRNPSTERV